MSPTHIYWCMLTPRVHRLNMCVVVAGLLGGGRGPECAGFGGGGETGGAGEARSAHLEDGNGGASTVARLRVHGRGA